MELPHVITWRSYKQWSYHMWWLGNGVTTCDDLKEIKAMKLPHVMTWRRYKQWSYYIWRLEEGINVKIHLVSMTISGHNKSYTYVFKLLGDDGCNDQGWIASHSITSWSLSIQDVSHPTCNSVLNKLSSYHGSPEMVEGQKKHVVEVEGTKEAGKRGGWLRREN